MMGLWLSSLCAAATVGLVRAEFLGARGWQLLLKPLASAAFVALALWRWPAAHSDAAAWWLGGLILGAVGDVLLLGRGKAWFIAGLVAFLLGHVAYVVAMLNDGSPPPWVPSAPLILVTATLLGLGLVVGRWLWPHVGKLRPAVIAYMVVISAMVLVATAPLCQGQASPRIGLICLGAILFFVSDLAVARDKFISAGPQNKLWGLPLYYAAQLVMAWQL